MIKQRKVIVSIIVFTVILFSLFGCNKSSEDSAKDTTPSTETTSIVSDSTETEENSVEEETAEIEENEQEQKEDLEDAPQEQSQESEQKTDKDEEQEESQEEPQDVKSAQADEKLTTQTSTISVSGTYHYEEAYKMLELVNNYRRQLGLGEVVWDETLKDASKIRAAEASICWSHTRPNGTQWYTVSNAVGGENLAKGYSTAEEVFNAWLASDGHRENIEWPEFTRMYVSYFEADNGWFWAQEFGY